MGELIHGWRRVPVLFAAVALAACADDGSTAPLHPPDIEIQGVEDGAIYTEPVTIHLDVSRGSYTATLNDRPFASGTTVSDLGDHRLVVTARAGEAEATRAVDFRIELAEGSVLIVRMFDLGENDAGGGGDAILLTDSADSFMRHVLVDAGPAGVDGSDNDYVSARLGTLGVSRLEALLLTHAHSDHFDGMLDVLESIQVDRFIYNGQVRSYSRYNQLIQQAHSRADTVIIPSELYSIELSGSSGTEVTVVPPLATYLDDPAAASNELNEGSLGTVVLRPGFSMFMTGDGEVEANERWRLEYAPLSGDVEVLKVGHHAGNDAIFDNGFSGHSSWLEHTDPEIMLISANGTTHPRHTALTKILGRSNTRTYCTNVHGDIELRVDVEGMAWVEVERNPDEDCEAGRDATT